MNYYQSPVSVMDLPVTDRATFIKRTYTHVAGALAVFAGLEYILLTTPAAGTLFSLVANGKFTWLIVLGLFMLVSMVAQKWASSAVSRKTQYAGLGLYIAAESVIFAPLLYFATRFDAVILPKAALITTGLFLGLTWVAFTTKKDFSFLGGILKVAGFVAIGTIVASIVFGFTLGIIFTSIMLLLLGGTVLYQTSNVIHHYNTNQYVAASLALFASFATMLWYVIQLLIQLAASRD